MNELIQLWQSALDSPRGIKVRTPEPDKLRQRLYQARSQCLTDNFDSLALILDPRDPEILLVVKKEQPDAS